MKKRSLTIISIISIIIISLMLLGLTYGFFLAKITGNDSANSLVVTSGESAVEFTDLSEEISGIIKPGYEVVKPFTVENIGDLKANYSIYLVDVINEFNRTQDLTYTLYRTIGTVAETITTETDFSNWTELKKDIEYPKTSSAIQSNEILENSGDIYTYVLKITYINHPSENQNEDQGKTFSGTINIRATDSEINPFSETSLANNIINNAINNTNGTKFLTQPIPEENLEKDGTAYKVEFPLSYIYSYGDTKEEAENCSRGDSCFVNGNEKICSTFINKYVVDGDTGSTFYISGCNGEVPYYNIYLEKTMTVTQDDYGKSYYYRGPVKDNYVNFADMCWRIVRINGDGSIKLILEDQYATCDDKETQKTAATYTGDWNIGSGSYNYSSYGIGKLTYSDGTTNTDSVVLPDYLHGTSGGMREAFKTFQSNFTSEELDKMKSGGWCLNDTKSYSRSGASAPYTYTLLTEPERIDSYAYDVKGQAVYYDSFVRLFGESSNGVNQTLICQGTVINDFADDEDSPTPMYVSTLILDELMYAGVDNTNMKKYNYLTDNNYNTTDWLPLNIANNGGDPSMIFAYSYNNYGLSSRDSLGRGNFRPAINLASKTTFKDGNGTIEDPYEVE